jgi:hypothetical protein
MASARLHYGNTHLITYHIPGVVSASVNDHDVVFVAPRRGKILDVRAAYGVAAATTSVIIDINKSTSAQAASAGTTIYTTQADRLTVAASAFNSSSALPAVTTFAEGDKLSIEVDQADTGPTAADLTIQIEVAYY